MPYLFLAVGAIIFVTAFQNTHSAFWKQLKKDIAGDKGKAGFGWWMIAIAMLSAIGYVARKNESTSTLASMMIFLIGLAIIIRNYGAGNDFFGNLRTQLREGFAGGKDVVASGAGGDDESSFDKVLDIGKKVLPFIL